MIATQLIYTYKGMGELGHRRAGQELDAQIEANYNYVINHYKTREQMFLNKMIQDYKIQENITLEAISQEMTKFLTEEFQNKFYQKVMSAIDFGETPGAGGKYSNVNETILRELKIPEEKILRIKNGTNNLNIYSELGFLYEDWVDNKAGEIAASLGNEGLAQILSLLFNMFEGSGSRRTNSSIRGNWLEIRPDLISAEGLHYLKNSRGKNTVLVDESGLAVELQNHISISNLRKESAKLTEDFALIQRYLNSSMFGFSLKTWKNIDEEHKLTGASGVKNSLQATYDSSNGKTWNALYAYRTMLYVISEFLFEILGPVNIAYLSRNKFEWASDFLSNRILYMNVYSKKQIVDRGKGVEILAPYVNSNNIYTKTFGNTGHLSDALRNISARQTLNASGTYTDEDGTTGEYYKLEIKSNRR